MKNIGILTTFGSFDEAYSLCGVVSQQIVALVKHNYPVTLFLLDCFPEKDLVKIPFADKITIKRTIPTITFEPYQGIAANRVVPACFEKDVAKITPAFDEQFKEIEIMLCHDIIFQDSFLAYNAALRKMIMQKEQKFLHWMHSGPSLRPSDLTEPISFLYSLPPQSLLIYMNSYGVVGAAEMYDTFPEMVRVVHNPIDYRTVSWIHPAVKDVIGQGKLMEADIIAIYPLSSTRMREGGKQLDKAIKIMGYLKSEIGLNVKYVVCNAHANAEREKMAIQELLIMGQNRGLKPMEDLIFTSLITPPKFENVFPHDAVLQLFMISDIFLFPSVSENCPLILLEAGLMKNLLVLNEDFTPMKDFVGPDALYFKFDSIMTKTTHPRGEDVYYCDAAKIINSELNRNLIWKSHKDIRNKFSLDYMLKKELEPIFYESDQPAPEQPKAKKIEFANKLQNLMDEYGVKL